MNQKIVIAPLVVKRRQPENLNENDFFLFEKEIRREFQAVSIYELSNVFLREYDLWFKGKYTTQFTSYQVSFNFKTKIKKRLNYYYGLLFCKRKMETLAIVYDSWSTNYFHWLCDSLPRLLVINDFYKKPFQVIIPKNLDKYDFVLSSLKHLGYPVPLIMDEAGLLCTNIVTIDHTAPTGNFNPELIKNLRDLLLKSIVSDSQDTGPVKIFISRRSASKRKILNEAQLLPVLIKHGFLIVETEAKSFEEQVTLFSKCTVLMSLHGAGLTNMIFMKSDQSKVIEIRSKNDTHNNTYFSLASDLGSDYYYVLAEAIGNTTQVADFTVDVLAIEVLLKRII